MKCSALTGYLAAFALSGCCLAQTTWYVDASAQPPWSGTQANPFVALQQALQVVGPNDTIQLAAGGYGGPVDLTQFPVTLRGPSVPPGASPLAVIYGGFNHPGLELGTGSVAEDLKITGEQTSGGVQLIGGAILRRCEVTGNRSEIWFVAAGVHTDPGPSLIEDCNIHHNQGFADPFTGAGAPGGLSAFQGTIVRRTRIAFNDGGATYQTNHGTVGGVRLRGASLIDCVIENNAIADSPVPLTVSGGAGGISGYGTVESSVIRDNRGSRGDVGGPGGALSQNGTLTLVHCTLTGNLGGAGGMGPGIFPPLPGAGGVMGCSVANSILWGNVATAGGPNEADPASIITHSTIQNGFSGTGNLSLDPELTDITLSDTSPCINAASLGAPVPPVAFGGGPRVLYGLPDMGATEYRFGSCADPSPLPVGSGELLTVNGTTGGFDRQVSVPLGVPLTISMGQPASNALPVHFVLTAHVTLPVPNGPWLSPFGLFCVPPIVAGTGDPGLVTLVNTLDPASSLFPTGPGAWSGTIPGFSTPFVAILQTAFVATPMPATYAKSNAVVVNIGL